MAKRRRERPGGLPGLVPMGARTLTAGQKRALLRRMHALAGPERSFVAQVYRRALEARGRLDDDVYGILQATLDALAQNRGVPPPLIFGVTHHETGRVEQIRFLPAGISRIPAGARGRFVTNHPGFLRARPDGLPPRRGGDRQQLEG